MPRLALFSALVLLTGSTARAQDDAPLMEIEAFEPEAAPEPVKVRVYGTVHGRAGVDTRFDSMRGEPLAENVFELSTRAALGVDARISSTVRVQAEARAWWRAAAERDLDRSKGLFEVDVGEAFIDLYSPSVDLRIGNQIVAFGANPAFAPADGLNPRDLRESLLLAEPGDVKLPNLAVRALGTTGRVTWTAAYFPFFKPNRYAVTGQDEGVVQPVLGMAPPYVPDASIEDELQPHLLETERPRALPWLGDLGLRATTEAGRFTVGASWIWMNEKMPSVQLDPELSQLVRARARGADPDRAVLASLQDRALAGQTLATGRYERQHVVSFEAQTLIGTTQLDLDLSWSPAQTLFDAGLQPIRKQTFSWVVGLSQAEDSPLLYSVSWVGLAVPDLPSDGYLFLLEPATASGAPRTVWFQTLLGTVGYRLLDQRLEVSVKAAVEPVQRSWAFSPRVTWRGWARTQVGVAAEFYEGRPWSPFGYFGRNDQVVALFSTELL